MQEEAEVECPYCGEIISILIETSLSQQSYIEDCSVCCRPIQLIIHCEDEHVTSVNADRSV